MEAARSRTVRFQLRRYNSSEQRFENDLVARLPGLLITQFAVPEDDGAADRLALRFDFVDDWYSVLAFLDSDKQPTGHYLITIQTPLGNEDGVWQGDNLALGLEVLPEGQYVITGEEDFYAAVEEGWMKVYAAAKAKETLRKLCLMLDEGCLPQEVMDAVGG